MLITPRSTVAYAQREAGGKGYNLYRMGNAGFPVPAWIVLGAGVFKAFVKDGLGDAITEVLQREEQDVDAAAARIHALITEAPWPAEVEQAAREAYRSLGAEVISVRSSAVEEDSPRFSFAGQLSSYLFVRSEEEALTRLRHCWASAYSARGLSYRRQHGLDVSVEAGVAVVFQQMIACETSGVLFTCDPIKGDPDVLTINAVYGLGEGLVSGLLDGDTYVVDKRSGELLSSEIADKQAQVVARPEGGVHEVPVEDKALHEVPALDTAALAALTDLGRRVEDYYQFPQDIEWGFCDGELYLLQARPVTTPVRQGVGKLHIWDNSNIIESYGGITLPLTFSFAHYVYHQVYVQFCEILMVPPAEIRNMEPFLKNMLGSIHGRVYYNILNWYKLTSILPGFKYNRSFMETMMGTPHHLADEIADRIKPPGSQEELPAKLRRLITGGKFFYFHLTAQRLVDGFLEYFKPVYEEFRRKDYTRLPADEIYEDYKQLEQRLLRQWKAPIINDYLCMVHFGLLKKLSGQWLGQLGEALQNDLLAGEGNMESAEPTRELIRMAGSAAEEPALRELLLETPAADLMEALNQSEHSAFFGRVRRYIDNYGFRCMSEMKLEQKDLHQDPSFLFVTLKNYLRAGQIDLAEYECREREIRQGAEAKVDQHLRGWRKPVYLWSLKNARQAVRNRENLRFCRTRVYGVVRAMFHGMGRDFTARDMIDRTEDIFYLTVQELTSCFDGTLTTQDLRPLIALRKQQYAGYEEADPAPRLITRGQIYWGNDLGPEELEVEGAEDVPEGCLKGIGCCPGTVEGTVKKIMSPDDDMELSGEILVTERTDPGWIPLYPSVSGLLVERGGLLSHSAIVAREMGLPTVVGIKGLTKQLETGMRVRFDGQSGLIEIL
jgi:phosphohistidine swiveling domain-containing protein